MTPIKPPKKISHPFLKGIPAKYQKILLKNAQVALIRAGEFVFLDGGKADRFYLILKGKIDLLTEEQDVRFDPDSKLGVLQSLGPRDIVGWSWIIPPYRWRFNARAAQDSRLLVLDGKAIRQKALKDRALGYEIYKKLVPVMNQRLIASRIKLATFGFTPFESEVGG